MGMVVYIFSLPVLLRLVSGGIIFELLSLVLGATRSLLIFVVGRVFGVGLCWMSMRALLRGIMVGGVWNGFLLGRVRSQPSPCRFCGAPDGDGHLFWECTFPPLVEIRESPEFHDLVRFIGLAACFGMAGFLCCPVSMVPLFGTLMLLRVLVTWLRSRLGVILLTC